VLLKNKRFRRNIVFVGDGSHLKREVLWRLERLGSGDQVGSETARQEVARRTGREYEAKHSREGEDR
jgi:hypothetical protein